MYWVRGCVPGAARLVGSSCCWAIRVGVYAYRCRSRWYEDVLKREFMRTSITSAEVDALLNYLFGVADLIETQFRLRPALRDPGDECSVVYRAGGGPRRSVHCNVQQPGPSSVPRLIAFRWSNRSSFCGK